MPPNSIELSARLASRLVDELRGARADSLQNIVRLATRGAGELGERMITEARLVFTRESEVVVQAAELHRAIPTAERAVDLMQPLEGAVERMGRMVDRLPGGRGRDARDEPRSP